jgi:uncharacterized membrane protein (Fun14 family)
LGGAFGRHSQYYALKKVIKVVAIIAGFSHSPGISCYQEIASLNWDKLQAISETHSSHLQRNATNP